MRTAVITHHWQTTWITTSSSAHLRLAGEELVAFSFEDGAVWVTGRGFEVELSALPRW